MICHRMSSVINYI